MSSKTIMPGWSFAGAVIAFLLLLTMALYQQTVIYLSSIWNELSVGEYAHGYLVLAISIYLIFYNRKKLAKITPCPSYAILPLVLSATLLWLVAVIVDVEMLQSVALLFVFVTVVWTMAGHQAMKLLAFPLLFIIFALPVWFPLSPLLQVFTADIVFWITRTLEIPAFRQENLILVPAGTFSIEEACSGLRYLLAALTLGSLYAYLNYVTLTARVAVVFIAAGAALLANILRVFIVVYLGYATEMQHPWVNDHLMLGWYLFGGLVAILLFIDARFYRHDVIVEDVVTEKIGVTKPCQKGRVHYFNIVTFCVISLLIGPAVAYQKNQQLKPVVSNIDIVLPGDLKGWSGPVASTNDWMPQYHGAISSKSDYQVRGETVSLFIAYYPLQKQGEEVINDLNRISIKKIWRTKYSHSHVRQLPAQEVLEQVIENNRGDKRLVWYWYNIGGQITVNKYEAKVLQLMGTLLSKPQAYAVAVSVPLNNDIELSRESMLGIVSDLKKPLANIQVTNGR